MIVNILATNLMYLLNLTESFPLDGIKVYINDNRDIVYTMSSIIKIYESTFTEQYSLLSSLLQHILTLIQSSKNDGNFNVINTYKCELLYLIIFLVFNMIKKQQKFLSVLQNLCLSENNNVCFLTYKTIIQLCQIEKELDSKSKDKILVGFVYFYNYLHQI